jgi:chondroitin synthase
MKGISVVIPAYNRKSMLCNTLAGLANQRDFREKIEVIIVDNGSNYPLTPNDVDLLSLFPVRIVRRDLQRSNFRPASARNIGVRYARFNVLIFLDSDCIPCPSFFAAHWEVLNARAKVATIGHRVFVEAKSINKDILLTGGDSLSGLTPVSSMSNYLSPVDRRLKELVVFRHHPAPYNCFHGCNVGLKKEDFYTAGSFNEGFDGYWGYEDIEFGYRLFINGVELLYVSEAVVYHQEGEGLSLEDRLRGRKRNYEIACSMIPYFQFFRKELGR